MKKIEKITAQGEWVVLEARKAVVEEKKCGIILPNGTPNGQNVNGRDGKVIVDFFVDSIGDKAKDKVTYKIGDMVVIDNYDCQTIGDDDKLYGICHYSKVKAVIEN